MNSCFRDGPEVNNKTWLKTYVTISNSHKKAG